MKRKKIKTKNFTILYEEFNSFSEMIEISDGRKNKFGYNRDVRDIGIDGIETWEQGVKMLHNYTANLEKVKAELREVDRNKTVERKTSKIFNDVAGHQPIVPHALMGLPKSMINSKLEPKKSKILDVLVDGTYAWHVSNEEVAEYYSKVLGYLAGLEKEGFRLRLSLYYNFGKDHVRQTHSCKILLKSENQPLDIKRLLFPITHTGAFRAFGWDWYERLPEGEHISGYGQALHHWGKHEKQEVLDALGSLNKKAYYINYNCDYKRVFEGVR